MSSLNGVKKKKKPYWSLFKKEERHLETMNVKNKYSTVYFHVFCHKKEQRNGIVARRGIAREAVFCFLFFDIYLFCCAKSWLQHARSSVFTGACKLLAVARVYLGP